MPGRPSARRSRSTGGVITPRSSAISCSAPSSARAASKTAPPGPRRQRPARALRARAGTDQYATKPRKWSMRARSASWPHGAGVRSTSGNRCAAAPASRRAGCPTAARSRSAHRAERRPRSRAGRDRDARGGRRCAARRRAGCRRSAGRLAQPRSAAARSTRARSAPGPPRRPRRRSAPSRRSRRRARRGKTASSAGKTRASGSASRPGQPAKADVEVYGDPERSGGPSGSTCHHDWPAAASQSTNA